LQDEYLTCGFHLLRLRKVVAATEKANLVGREVTGAVKPAEVITNASRNKA